MKKEVATLKKVRKLLSWALLAAAVVFLALSARQFLGYRKEAQAAEKAKRLAQVQPGQPTSAPETTPPAQTTPPEAAATRPNSGIDASWSEPLEEKAKFLLEVELDALKAENPDVIGWICIPDTKLSYPLLQGEDNSYYLDHAWDGSKSTAGSIFLECQNSPDLLDFNTIVYGHHMANGSCFAPLISYRKEAFRQEHPYVYIVTATDVRRYEIFSAYEAPVESDTYRMNFGSSAKKQAALEHYIQSSLWRAPSAPEANSYILTLSTCVGNGRYEKRFVVQGMLTGIFLRAT